MGSILGLASFPHTIAAAVITARGAQRRYRNLGRLPASEYRSP